MRVVVLLVAVLLAGCCSTAPQPIQDALAHQLEDLVQAEAELLPLVPEAATVTYTALDGSTQTAPARTVWRGILRSSQDRVAALLAWAKGQTYDPGSFLGPVTEPR